MEESATAGASKTEDCVLRGIWRRLSRIAAIAWLAACASSELAAKPLRLKGQLGYMGEWAFSSILDQVNAPNAPDRFYSGPFTMRHVGLCSADGPEERNGMLTVAFRSNGSDTLTLSYEGRRCVFAGVFDPWKGAVRGYMRCENGSEVPLYFWNSEP